MPHLLGHRSVGSWARATCLGFALAGLVAGATQAQVITEFSLGISAGAVPLNITPGPDGNLWFTEFSGNRIGRITPLGVITEFSAGITSGADLVGIKAGPDGNLWFTERAVDRIGRITPLGVVTEFSTGITPGAGPGLLTVGPDGNLWFTEETGDAIGRITPLGGVTEFSAGITAGAPDGNLWFTEKTGNAIGRITPLGVVTEFSTRIAGSIFPVFPDAITAGPDGNLWFTEDFSQAVWRITPLGLISFFGVGITPGSDPVGIAAGPDGNLWFTEESGNRIARITTPSGCANATTLCIDYSPGDGRFQIQVSYHTVQGGGLSGSGHAIALSSLGVTEGGLFWFFGAANPEMLIKIIDGCSLGEHFWVFFAATTNVGFTVTVADTATGHQAVYHNKDLTAALPVQDTSALLCP